MRRVPQQYPNPYVRRERAPRAARRQALLLAGCLALACGLIYAVRQQVMAVDYGYKAEALRREREGLLDEQHRPLLAVHERSSRARLEAAGRARGMQPARGGEIESAAARGTQREPGVFVGTAGTGAVLRR